MDQAAEDGSALDPVRCDVGDRVVRPGQLEVERAVRASSVVVPGVLGQDSAQVPFTEDQHPVGYFRPDGEYEPFCIGIRARAPGRNLHGGDAGIGQDRLPHLRKRSEWVALSRPGPEYVGPRFGPRGPSGEEEGYL